MSERLETATKLYGVPLLLSVRGPHPRIVLRVLLCTGVYLGLGFWVENWLGTARSIQVNW